MKYLYHLIFLIFILSSHSLLAQSEEVYQKIDSLEQALQQTSNDSLKYETLVYLYKLTNQYSMLDELLRYIEMQDDLNERTKNPEHMAITRFMKARFYFGRYYKMDTALIFLKEAEAILDTSENVANRDLRKLSNLNLMGLIYKNKNAFDSALNCFNNIISYPGSYFDPTFLAYINASNIYTTLGNHDRALDYTHHALSLAKNDNEKRKVYALDREGYILNALTVLGRKYIAQGAYEKAIEILDGVIASYQAKKESEETVNDILYFKSQCLIFLNQFDEAEELLLRSLALNTSIYGENHPKLLRLYMNLGSINGKSEDYSEAVEYLGKALTISTDISNNRYICSSYLHLGQVEESRADFNQATYYYSMADKYAASVDLASAVTNGYGSVLFKMKEYKQAADAYKKSLILIDTTQKLTIDNLSNSWSNARKIGIIGESYEKLFVQDLKQENLEQALHFYMLGDQLVNRLRGIYKTHEDEVEFAKLHTNIYEGSVRVSLLLHELSNNGAYLESAFQFAERGKSSALLTSILDVRPQFSNLSDSISNRETDLKSNIQFYQTRLARGSKDTTLLSQYRESLAFNKAEYETLLLELEKNYPEYYQLKHYRELLSIEDVQNKLIQNQTILEYSFHRDSLVAFIIDKKEIQLVKLDIPNNLDSLVYGFNKSLKNQYSKDYIEFGAKLYEVLYQPVAELVNTSELVIVPDCELWHVNFELLPTNGDGDYLLFERAISYANSANHFVRQTAKQSITGEGCLAFSYSATNDELRGEQIDLTALRNQQDDIPGTLEEVKSISEIFAGNYLYGAMANERNFKELAKNYSILHLALHGEVNDSEPNYSRLTFAKNESDTLEDNFLHAFELYNMKLNADMVVLSACNTGVGKLEGGEGIMSLGRAFQYAGTKSVLLSNWEVVDGAAPELMKHYYTYLDDGKSKSEALRLAKMQYLKTASVLRSHPYYWGTFTLLGDTTTIKKKNHVFYWMLGVMMMIFFVGYIWRKRQTA